jgi:predicted DNA-binding antitoxin AbrB/MazE fold protein
MAKVKRPRIRLRLKTGEAVTTKLINELAAEAETGYDLSKAKKRRVGRPSLAEGTSPRISFRITEKTFRRARRRAAAENTTVSELARTALEQLVASPR